MREAWFGALVALFLFAGPAQAQVEGPQFSATGNLDNTTDVSLMAAVPLNQYCVTGVVVTSSATIGADTVVRVLSADTPIWSCAVDTTGLVGCKQDLNTPVCTVTGEALEIDSSADVTDDLVYYSIQGFTRRMPNPSITTP